MTLQQRSSLLLLIDGLLTSFSIDHDRWPWHCGHHDAHPSNKILQRTNLLRFLLRQHTWQRVIRIAFWTMMASRAIQDLQLKTIGTVTTCYQEPQPEIIFQEATVNCTVQDQEPDNFGMQRLIVPFRTSNRKFSGTWQRAIRISNMVTSGNNG